LIQRARTRLIATAGVFAIAVWLASATVYDVSAFEGVAPLAALVAFVISIAAGLVVLGTIRRSLRDLATSTQDVVRDSSRRVPPVDAAPTDEVRQLAEWVNFLAEDAERSHRALARERALLSALADGTTQGVIAVDDDHKIELLNDAAREMLGVTSSPVGEPLIEFVRVPQLFELLEADETASAEVTVADHRRMIIKVAQKWGSEGRVLLLEDVTTVRRLETVRRDFIANVSHELRTPVAVIRANAETLISGAKDDPVMGPKLMDGMHRNAERLARILADLLDLSRLDAGQYRLEIKTVPLRSAVEQSLSAVEPSARARNVKLHLDVEGDVKADPKALDQILVNLIDNAVKYTRADGNVWVQSKRDDNNRIRIEVRDDGVGIADKHRERVFERFYRADSSRTREAGGTGLGLSIVKHLTESMHGKVGVEPNQPQGSIFWLRLPGGP
jgi:two-component system, OmpR family, phosphate regulon sensor histidine kinase PhoR